MRGILTWHSLDTSGSPISVAPDVFRQQVRFLASGRVRVVSLTELAHSPDDGTDVVALTFDDGFANVGDIAVPLLREHSLTATIFAVTEHVGGFNDWGGRSVQGIPTLPLMDWTSLGAVREAGLEVGAHTRRHRDLTTVSGAALEDEVAGCVEVIAAKTGVRPASFAYPYGGVGADAVVAIRDVYQQAVTTELRLLDRSEDLALLPRLDMFYFRSPGQLEAWGRRSFKQRLWLRAQGRRVRAMVAGAQGLGAHHE
ncbi:MAG: polysaccharide deacetylase family protein [Gemmatimonadaceae bacterium]